MKNYKFFHRNFIWPNSSTHITLAPTTYYSYITQRHVFMMLLWRKCGMSSNIIHCACCSKNANNSRVRITFLNYILKCRSLDGTNGARQGQGIMVFPTKNEMKIINWEHDSM